MASTHRTKITTTFLRGIKPTGRRETYRDDTVVGLIVRVSPDATRQTWAIDYRNRDGKRQTFTIGPSTLWDATEAKAEARRLLASIGKGRDPAAEKRRGKSETVEAAARTLEGYLGGDYREHVLSRRKSGHATESRIRAAWEPFLGQDMAALTVKAVVAHVSMRQKAAVKATTLNRDRTALLALLNQAVKDEQLATNPLERWQRLAVTGDKRVRWLGMMDEHEDHPQGERERFMTALADCATLNYLRDLVQLLINTGIRRGEALGLSWGAVDLKASRLTVAATTTKTNRPRHVPLNTVALGVLRARRLRLGALPMPLAPVFPNPSTGEALTHVKRSWASLVKRAQVQDFHLHDLRHDFASRLVQAGVDLYVVKDLLGHSSITLTERYAHLAPRAGKSAVDLLS